jgi:NAD(P)-dependent dehydrogenase (short-subunit alcohol dehydrogenase family)
MAGSLEGKIALITGAARRIGNATAKTLAGQGASIVIHSRQEADAADLVADLDAIGATSWVVTADLQQPEEYERLVERAVAAAGSLHILVNNASVFPPSTLHEVTFADLVQNAEVNAWVPFTLMRSFARLVGRGSIVNILDTRIGGYDWNHVAYLLSKLLLASLTRTCALAYAPSITVNGVAPGLILPPPGKDMRYLAQLAETVPLKRHGGPDDVASAVLYLATNHFITGQVIHVDGGAHLDLGGGTPRQ